jgi:hypothetical protein
VSVCGVCVYLCVSVCVSVCVCVCCVCMWVCASTIEMRCLDVTSSYNALSTSNKVQFVEYEQHVANGLQAERPLPCAKQHVADGLQATMC